MTDKRICNEEGSRFPVEEFVAVTDPDVTIHVTTATSGHTTDGWPATFKVEGKLYSEYTLSEVEVQRIPVVADAAPPAEVDE